MENLREQIFQATDNFLTVLQQLAQAHTKHVFEETLESLGHSNGSGSGNGKGKSAGAASRPRGVKRGTDELEQLSSRFAQFVHANPGLRIEQINKQLGTTTKDLALPIRKLISEGQIKVKGQKRSTTYFAGKSAANADVAPTEEAAETAKEATAPAAKSGKKRSRPKKSRPRSRAKSKK
jgi:hypothetical protein